MKVKLLNMAVAALLLSGATQAMADSSDVSATLQIGGTVNAASTNNCQIELSDSVINLYSASGALTEQDANATSATPLSFTVKSVDKYSECGKKIYDGQIAVKFVGTYDEAEGNAFANTLTGESAAKGVGIGMFDMKNAPIDVSQMYKIVDNTNISTNIIGLQMIKLKGQTVTPGSVAGGITFQIERL